MVVDDSLISGGRSSAAGSAALTGSSRVGRGGSDTPQLDPPHPGDPGKNGYVSADEIDAYLAELDEQRRTTLEALRRSVLRVVPEAEQCISYGLPAFRVRGKVVAGFGAFKSHLAYLPHSGQVLENVADHLTGYSRTSGSLHFPLDQPLPDDLVRRLIEAKLELLER